MDSPSITIDERFHGPRHSGNGGYVCGRVAKYIQGTATVRLIVPPPLDTPLQVEQRQEKIRLVKGDRLIAEGWPAELQLDVPPPPSPEEAEQASRSFKGFASHRFRSCFVCGPERKKGDGLHIFAGQVTGRSIVASSWIPYPALAEDGRRVSSEFVWGVLDCPGGFSFPEPQEGTILLGQLTVQLVNPVFVAEQYTVMGWEISRDGRKHHTGTALFSKSGECCGMGRGIWFEVAGFTDEP